MENTETQTDTGAQLLAVPSTDLLAALRCLRLLRECPPTVRRIIESGDRAIDLAGLNPWCMNEGLASGDESHLPWCLDSAIEALENAIPANAEAMYERGKH